MKPKVIYSSNKGVVDVRVLYSNVKGAATLTLEVDGVQTLTTNYFDTTKTICKSFVRRVKRLVKQEDIEDLQAPFLLAYEYGGYVLGRKPKAPPPNLEGLH